MTSSMPGGPWSAGTAVMSTRPTERCDQSAMPAHGGPEVLAGPRRAQHERHGHREVGAPRVEVVVVLVVRGQHDVDLPELGRLQCRTAGLDERGVAVGVGVGLRVVERRVDQESQAAVLEHGGRTAQIQKGRGRGGVLLRVHRLTL